MAVSYKKNEVDTNKALFTIYTGLCKGCGLCIEKCPVKTLIWAKELGVYGTPAVAPRNAEECIGCGICASVCPDCAIVIEKK